MHTISPPRHEGERYILKSRARFARAQFSYHDIEALSLVGGWRAGALGSRLSIYIFLRRNANGKEHKEHLPQCPDVRTSTSIEAQPMIDIGIILQ